MASPPAVPSVDPFETTIAEAEALLKRRDFEGARKKAEPVFTDFFQKSRSLTPRLQRLFGVFVAAQNGDMNALLLLDQPLLAAPKQES